MACEIHAIAHIGHLKLYVGDASCIRTSWSPLLAQLNSGTYPNTTLQAVWNKEQGKRRFSFHTRQDLLRDHEIIGIEKLLSDAH